MILMVKDATPLLLNDIKFLLFKNLNRIYAKLGLFTQKTVQ